MADKPSTIEIPWAQMVREADPGFERARHREVTYEFENKAFIDDPDKAGPYSATPNVNPYTNYRPPTRVTTVEMPWLTLVNQADPDYQRARHRELVYMFENRNFYEDPYTRGPYNRAPDDNVPTRLLLHSDSVIIELVSGGDLWQAGVAP